MTADELARHLACYEAGLKAQMAILAQIQHLSADQRDAMVLQDLDRVTARADERARLMSGLVQVEHEIRPARHALADHRGRATGLPGFAETVALHKAATLMVRAIIAADESTLTALRDAETVRREASQVLAAGRSSLAAYRRVLTPDLSTPSLVDRRG